MGADRTGVQDPAAGLLEPFEVDHLRATVFARVFGEPAAAVRVAGRYRVLERVGAGAMGAVYAAYDEQLDRKIALKILHHAADETEARERLLREAKALARLSHPNVVQVHDAGTWDGQVFVAMEFVLGTTLSGWLDEAQRSVPEILARFTEAGQGLATAHEAAIVHRDFKPDNVLVGDDGRVRVADFGLAFATADEATSGLAELGGAPLAQNVLTRTGIILGTPAYMAPEQLRGEEADGRCDQFSFAVALVEALFGRRPFMGATLFELQDAIAAGYTPPGDRRVPAGVREALVRALKEDPSQRFESMEALLHALAPPGESPRRRPRAFVVALGVVAAAGVLAPVAWVTGGDRVGATLARAALDARSQHADAEASAEAGAAAVLDATALLDADPSAAAARIHELGAQPLSPDAQALLSAAWARGVADRIYTFEKQMIPIDAHGGWVRWQQEPRVRATGSEPWMGVAFDPSRGSFVASPRDGVWAEGAVLSWYEHGRGLERWPLDGSPMRTLNPDGDHDVRLVGPSAGGRFAGLHGIEGLDVYDTVSGQRTHYGDYGALEADAAALSSDGRWVAEVDSEGQLVLHELSRGKAITPSGRFTGAPRFSADMRWVGALQLDRKPALLNARTGARVAALDHEASGFEFSPSGDYLVVCLPSGTTGNRRASVYALPDASLVARIFGEARPDCAVEFSADEQRVAISSDGGPVQVAEIGSGRQFSVHSDPAPHAASIAADGATLTTIAKGEVRVWDLDRQLDGIALDLEFAVHAEYVGPDQIAVARWSRSAPGGEFVRIDSASNTVATLTLHDPTPESPERDAVGKEHVAFALGGSAAAVARLTTGVQLFREGQPEVSFLEDDEVMSARFSSDGTRLFAATAGRGLVEVDLATRAIREGVCEGCPADLDQRHVRGARLHVSTDGSRVAMVVAQGAPDAADVSGLWVVDLATSKPTRHQPAAARSGWRVSPNLRFAIERLYDADQPDLLHDLDAGSTTPMLPGAQGIAVVDQQRVIYRHLGLLWVWDKKRDRRWAVMTREGEGPIRVAVSPTGEEATVFGFFRKARVISLVEPPAAVHTTYQRIDGPAPE